MNEQNPNPSVSNPERDPRLEPRMAPPQSQLPPPTTAVGSTYSATTAPQTNIWAVVSIVSSALSWLGLFGIGGIVGVIAGVVARNEIAASRGAQTGDGLALAGIILGALNIFGTCLVALCVLVFSVPLMLAGFGGW